MGQILRPGMTVTLKCLGNVEGPRYLDGRTRDGTVGLAPTTGGDYTGTHWLVEDGVDDGYGGITLKCLGAVDGPRYLNGRTQSGTVDLAPNPSGGYSGAHWEVIDEGDGRVSLKCLGTLGGPHYLNGLTQSGGVDLSPDNGGGYSGAHWQVAMVLVPGEIVTLECRDAQEGWDRFLDGRTGDGSVGLAPGTDPAHSGTRWLVTDGGAGAVFLQCLGTIDGPRFLNGLTELAKVSLAPSTNPPFSGTRWQIADEGDGRVTLKCLGSLDGPRYLDGHPADGGVNLAPDTGGSGAHWMVGAADDGWTAVGSGVASLFTSGNLLLCTDASSGSLLLFSGHHGLWTRLAGPAHQYVGNDDAVYAVPSAKDSVLQWDQRTDQWTPIGGAMESLVAGRHTLHGVTADGGVWMYSGTPNQWTRIGGPFRAVDANENFCFAIAADGNSVLSTPSGTSSWTTIGGPIAQIVAADNEHYGVDASGNVILNSGTPGQWTQIAGPVGALYAAGVNLFALSANKLSVALFLPDQGNQWEYVAGPADAIAANDDYLFGVRSSVALLHDLDAGAPSARSADAMGPPTNQHSWLFMFETADALAAGYDGWVELTLGNGAYQQALKLGLTHFERGGRYAIPMDFSPTQLTNLWIGGQGHMLPDHWTLATITAWSLTQGLEYRFTVNEDVPNQNDHPNVISLHPGSPTNTPSSLAATYIYIWTYVGINDAVGHASMMLSDGTYLSWWPSGQDRKTIPFVGLAYDAPHNDPQPYSEDERLEGHAPDLILKLYGLDEAAIKAWWVPFNNDASNHWNAAGMNCSTLVVTALRNGGALSRLDPLEFRIYVSEVGVWTPNLVATLVTVLARKPLGGAARR